MIRTPMRRTRMKRRRPKAAQPRVKGRPSVSVVAWRAIVLDLTTRCHSTCEVPWCRHVAAVEAHHVQPTSLGGSDSPENILMVCRTCHARFDAPFIKGKHVAEGLGRERFRVALEFRESKRGRLLAGSMQEFVTRPDGLF